MRARPSSLLASIMGHTTGFSPDPRPEKDLSGLHGSTAGESSDGPTPRRKDETDRGAEPPVNRENQ